jgi:23S rRNA (pseudouridine1915-N3)-methyltransferase
MEIQLLVLGKTNESVIQQLCDLYIQKIKHYSKFSFEVIDNHQIKSEDSDRIKEEEAKLTFKKIKDTDWLILLDENGKEFNSIQFSDQLQKWMNSGVKKVVFLVGGAFGFHQHIYDRANGKISLSKMTFSHQLIRPIFLEQLYRAFTILKNEPYHHR